MRLGEDSAEYAALLAREPAFHREAAGCGRAAFARMMTDDYWEVFASGGIGVRDMVLDVLEQRYAQPGYIDPWQSGGWRVEGFAVRQLEQNTFLATYTLWQGARKTRRASIWQRTDGGWKIAYHQGTIAEGE